MKASTDTRRKWALTPPIQGSDPISDATMKTTHQPLPEMGSDPSDSRGRPPPDS